MSDEICPCPFCGSLAVVKCRVDSDWGVDLKYRLLNDESNYEIKSMITDENYDPDYQTGDYWGIEIFRCQSCRAEWGGGTDVCVAALNARIAELEAAQRWIPVSERLPEFNKVVAVIDMSDKDSHLCNVYETAILVEVRGDTRFGFIGHSGWDSSDVTHWMPLPQPPEAQE